VGLINPYNGVYPGGGILAAPLGLVDGAVGAPSLYFNNSPTTGLYRIGADNMGIAIAGVLKVNFNATGNVQFLGNLRTTTGFVLGWDASSSLRSAVDGSILLSNNANTDFGLLQFGGITALFPSIKRDTIFPQLRLADNSGPCGAATGALPAGAAGRDGNVGFDLTLNALVYYVGGARYKVIGVAF
jgi:hypothetical protein